MGLILPKHQPFFNERMEMKFQKEERGACIMVFNPHQRLHLGAEAEVWKGEWFGHAAVRKQRRPRSWRHPDLDHRLGVRRMVSEARLLIRMRKAGLSVPAVWDLDYEGGQLIIQHLEGDPLIDVLNAEDAEAGRIQSILGGVGRAVRRLHREAATHGDLSSNNILVDGDTIHLIDFGLASIEYDVERFGIDLHVLDEILGASHPSVARGHQLGDRRLPSRRRGIGSCACSARRCCSISKGSIHASGRRSNSGSLSRLRTLRAFFLPLPHVPRHNHKG